MPLNPRLQTAWYRCRVHVCLVLGLHHSCEQVLALRLQAVADDVHALATQAHLLATRGDHAAARVPLQRLAVLRPDAAGVWFNLGYVLEQLECLPEAEQAFLSATRLDPDLDRAWYGLALCQIALQRLDAAAEALRKNTALQPMSPFGWYQLARLHAQRQETEQAEQIIRHLRSFEPRVAAQLVRETGLAAG